IDAGRGRAAPRPPDCVRFRTEGRILRRPGDDRCARSDPHRPHHRFQLGAHQPRRQPARQPLRRPLDRYAALCRDRGLSADDRVHARRPRGTGERRRRLRAGAAMRVRGDPSRPLHRRRITAAACFDPFGWLARPQSPWLHPRPQHPRPVRKPLRGCDRTDHRGHRAADRCAGASAGRHVRC
ncbi:hypothetical protein LTR94_031666, partial [Friedmanniomyces endolithicus]